MRLCTSCRRLLKPDAIRCPQDGAAVEDVETLPEGTKLGVYRIDRMLGEGGMGFVYAATHEVLNRRSAIKMLRPELSSNEQIVTRFLNEAKAVNLIDHPNIVNVYDYGDGGDGSVYFVMEFLEGETLDDLMRKRQAMAVPLFLHLFTQIAKALVAAHAKYIVHRDLKPANIYVVPREDNPAFVKLLDFGIAQLRGAGAVQGLTVMGSVMGTPQYMSPEQVTGGAVDARTDVWAMGVMMYRAISGQAPFKGEEFADLASKILYSEPQPVGELLQLPASLAKLISSCLERRLEGRCQSIGELLAGLERVKTECRLDDEAILYAAAADIEANAGMVVGADGRPMTRGSLAGSMPRFQGAGSYVAPARAGGGAGAAAGAGARSGAGAAKSKLPLVLGLGGALAAAAVAGYLALGRGKAESAEVTPPAVVQTETPPPAPAQRTIKAAFDEGKADEARALAEEALRAAISGGSLQQQGFAVDALAMVRVPATAPLLYLALKGQPDVRVKAARALGDLRLPDAAAKVRDALSDSGDRVKVELAAALYRLGGKDAKAILARAADEPTTRVLAASAMAEAGDDGGRAALTEALQDAPAGGEQWRKATGALARLGDAGARKLLEAELAQSNAARAVAAAELLARAGDANAKEYLARQVADAEFARRGEAALALARLDDKRALAWVAAGLASTDLDERRHALAVCGTLANAAAEHKPAIAAMATDDPELRVRMTAEAALLGMGGS
jgi:HEAT repeat protein/tRNA A-37 threonylcarbamoyl transferase component Bud32